MKAILKLILLVVLTTTLSALEPMKVAFVYTAGTPTSVQVRLADNTSSNLFQGESYTTNITPNSSGVIVVNVRDHAGSGTTWANFQASSVSTYTTLDIYVNGNLYAQYRLDQLILAQAQNGILDQDGNLTPPENGSGNIGTDELRWNSGYFEGETVHIGPADGEAGDTEMRLSYDDNTNTGSIAIDDENVIDATSDLITVNKIVSQEIGNDNTVFGKGAFLSGSNNRVSAFGLNAASLSSGSTVNAFGAFVAGTNTGSNVNAIGHFAAYNNSGNYLNALGEQTARDNTGNHVNASGFEAAFLNTGSYVNAFGFRAARNNSGSNLIAIGQNSGNGNTRSNVVLIGNGTLATADNQVVLGNSSTTETHLRGVTLMDLAGGGTQNIQVDNTGKIITGGGGGGGGGATATTDAVVNSNLTLTNTYQSIDVTFTLEANTVYQLYGYFILSETGSGKYDIKLDYTGTFISAESARFGSDISNLEGLNGSVTTSRRHADAFLVTNTAGTLTVQMKLNPSNTGTTQLTTTGQFTLIKF